MKIWQLRLAGVAGALLSVACGSSNPTGSGGTGTAHFTTWGEEYIEDGIPADPEGQTGFIDGWSVKYEKFLVNFQNIRVATTAGKVAAEFPGSLLFDNTQPDVKAIKEFADLPAQAYTDVSYEIAPVTTTSELSDSASAADKALMLAGGYSVYVAGTARKDAASLHFAWGFAIGTHYAGCHSEQDGKDQLGIVVTNNASLEVQLTTHGDHLFYDRLQADDVAQKTSLRFDSLAAADADADGELTLEELDAKVLDVKLYNPSGLDAATQGAFVSALARTIGHFRGEGECTISKL
ncbi:MAG: hypothetical protein QM756_07180 [Polyangiaceae bacterium]